MFTDADLILISALQHLLFCERQAALIHVERLWAENRLTISPAGRRRLSRAAKVCLDHSQRVQHSVFECQLDPAGVATLKARLLEVIDPKKDSLRFDDLGKNWRRGEHIAAKPSIDLDAALIA